MSTDGDKLVQFEEAIFDEVDEQIRRILDSAKQDKEKSLERLNDEVLVAAYNEIKTKIKHIQGEYVRKSSQYELDGKREVLRHREELSNKLFSQIEKRVDDFAASQEYEGFLCNNLKKALESTQTKTAIVYLRAEDMHFSDKLSAVSKQTLEFKPDSRILHGGLIIYFHEQKTVFDLSFDTSIENEKKRFIAAGDLKIS